MCQADNRTLGLISRTCRTIEELNKNLIDDTQQLQLEEQLKLKIQAPVAPLT